MGGSFLLVGAQGFGAVSLPPAPLLSGNRECYTTCNFIQKCVDEERAGQSGANQCARRPISPSEQFGMKAEAPADDLRGGGGK